MYVSKYQYGYDELGPQKSAIAESMVHLQNGTHLQNDIAVSRGAGFLEMFLRKGERDKESERIERKGKHNT